MSKTPIAAQMWTVREEAERDFLGALGRVAEIGYLGVELAGLYGTAPDEVLAAFERLDLELVGGSTSFLDDDVVERELAELAQIDCKVVVGHLPAERFASAPAAREAAEICNSRAARVADEGGVLCYHNHWWEFEPRADGGLPIDDFLEALDPAVPLVVDAYWVAAGGAPLVPTLEALAPRIRHVHLKDGPGNVDGLHVPIGQGEIDIPAIVAAVPDVGWHVAELDEYEGDPVEALEQSYCYLTESRLAYGRKAGKDVVSPGERERKPVFAPTSRPPAE
jgi:sugar phosphate isomerase/epimerase